VSTESVRRCELCGDPIQAGEAWLVADGDLAAHSGCVYRDDESDRQRWMPPETGG
jgi:hypothetical protein